MLILQKLWAVQWVWPIIAYTNLSYGHPLIPRRPDKRGFTVHSSTSVICMYTVDLFFKLTCFAQEGAPGGGGGGGGKTHWFGWGAGGSSSVSIPEPLLL